MFIITDCSKVKPPGAKTGCFCSRWSFWCYFKMETRRRFYLCRDIFSLRYNRFLWWIWFHSSVIDYSSPVVQGRLYLMDKHDPELLNHMLDLVSLPIHGETWRCLLHLYLLRWSFSNYRWHDSLSFQTYLPYFKVSLRQTSKQTRFNTNLKKESVEGVEGNVLYQFHTVMGKSCIYPMSTF